VEKKDSTKVLFQRFDRLIDELKAQGFSLEDAYEDPHSGGIFCGNAADDFAEPSIDIQQRLCGIGVAKLDSVWLEADELKKLNRQFRLSGEIDPAAMEVFFVAGNRHAAFVERWKSIGG
jgi:hypothetical protein